mmetsp:Transcript_27368/g.42070  ORF Transcript_27368/g.42070 Transcript_27368/m.42070 type:complete len:112 (-) Transcript_27368:37-372(-)
MSVAFLFQTLLTTGRSLTGMESKQTSNIGACLSISKARKLERHFLSVCLNFSENEINASKGRESSSVGMKLDCLFVSKLTFVIKRCIAHQRLDSAFPTLPYTRTYCASCGI